MNYGLLNFKAQNGKPGIFFTNEQSRKTAKKEYSLRVKSAPSHSVVDYKTRKQPFELRHHPKNYDRVEPEVDNVLKPLPDDKQQEPEKPKKPVKNFIQKNREKIVRGKKGKDDDKNGTVTLTQDQLNAILASVGKVATGEEDELKISFDSKHHEVLIESPRRKDYDDETEKHHRDRSEKENGHSKSRKDRRKKEDDSIYALMGGDSTNRSKKDREKRVERDSSDERDYRHRRSRDISRERDRRSDHDQSEERNHRRNKKSREDSEDRDHSRERYKRSHNRDRNHGRERDRNPSFDPDYDRKKKQEDSTDRILKDLRLKAESQLQKSRESDKFREAKVKDSETRDSKKSEPSTNHLSPDPNIDPVSPRELAGIPVTLPWKHMTKAERRRLMIAREKVIAEAEKKKEEDGKSRWREIVKEETEKLQTTKKRESRRRSPSYSPPRSRDGSRDRRHSGSRDRRERSRDRRHDRRSPSYERNGSRSRDRRRRSHSDDRRDSRSRERRHHRDSHSRERRSSREKSRDDSADRSRHRSHRRSPSPPTRQEDKVSSTSVATGASTRPPTNMTLAEKKKLQWDRERAESQVGYTPWGRPGAGAPLRSKSGKLAADYRARQVVNKENYPDTINEELDTINQNSSQNASEATKSRRERKESQREEVQRNEQLAPSQSNRNVPAAMRSSFVFGQIAPDTDRFENTKEQERQQWLKDLERQREEKREQQIKDYENTLKGTNTWADKFSNDYRPARLPEQPPESVRRDDVGGGVEAARISSAPVNVGQSQDDDDEDKTYIRGQNVYMDPVTKKELEDKRLRQLEHQKAVMEQVQEKQRQKQLERERKMAEDAEEERKLQAERDRLQRQFEVDQSKLKVREMKRQEEVERLKAAMDEAHEKAMREKYSRKMQHLEQGGHDTTQLKAHLAAKITPRGGEFRDPRGDPTHIVPSQVPGLDLELSPRLLGPPTAQYTQKDSYHEPHYTENRVLTPNKYRHHGHTAEFGTQTGMKVGDEVDTDRDEGPGIPIETKREVTDAGIMYKFVNNKRVRVKSAPKEEFQKNREPPENPKKRKAEKNKGKKLWNYQNKALKKPIKQSERDPLYEKKKEESRIRRQHREQQLREMVEKNRDIIPTERHTRTPGHSRDHSPVSDGGRTPRSTMKEYSAYSVRRAKSHSPDRSESRTATRTIERAESPINRKSPVSHHSISPAPSGRRSPPIPALRYRGSDRNSNYLPIDYDPAGLGTRIVSKYNDTDPLEIPVGNSQFVAYHRTVDILDPAKATSPMPLSREATQVANARKAYIKGMKPGNYGNRVDNYQDRMRMPNEQRRKDPILDPSLVTDHPTQRQDAILQQLSTMRENLMQRQRELETFSPTDLE
nr:trichohyalin isoform X9 [Crassostrea gigas]